MENRARRCDQTLSDSVLRSLSKETPGSSRDTDIERGPFLDVRPCSAFADSAASVKRQRAAGGVRP